MESTEHEANGGKAPTTAEAEILLEGMAVRAKLDIPSGEFSWQPSEVHKSSKSFGLVFGLEKSGTISLPEELLGFHLGASTIMFRLFPKTKPLAAGCIPTGEIRKQKDVLLDFQDHQAHNDFAEALETWLANSGRPRRLLVVVNPKSGKGHARELYLRQVLPLLESSAITVTMLETNYHRHAIDIARGLNLSLYDGMACVSGDGVATEVVNGFLERPDWQRAIQIPIGHIIAGSGNGLAKSAMEFGGEKTCNVVNTTFAIISGKCCPLDVITVSQGPKKFFSILNLGWGLTSDADIESEVYRWMGGARLTLQALVRIMALRQYNGSLSYLPASDEYLKEQGTPEVAEAAHLASLNNGAGPDGKFRGTPMEEMEGAGEWQTMEGQFTLVWGQNVPWAATDMLAAPRAQLCDGCMDVMVLQTASKAKILSLFLEMESGKHINSPIIQYLKVRAMKFSPGKRTKGKVPGGIVAMDGEVIARGVGAVGNRNDDIMEYEEPFNFTISQGLVQLYVA